MEEDLNGRRPKLKTNKMEYDQNRRRPNVRIEKVKVTDKNGPQIWTRGKMLLKRRYLDNGAIVQSLATILRLAIPVTLQILD